jgi:hypothetical protein
MTFARGARTSRAVGASGSPRGTELASILVPSLHDDCDLFGVVLIRSVEYRIKLWRIVGANGGECFKLQLERNTAKGAP